MNTEEKAKTRIFYTPPPPHTHKSCIFLLRSLPLLVHNYNCFLSLSSCYLSELIHVYHINALAFNSWTKIIHNQYFAWTYSFKAFIIIVFNCRFASAFIKKTTVFLSFVFRVTRKGWLKRRLKALKKSQVKSYLSNRVLKWLIKLFGRQRHNFTVVEIKTKH